MTIPLKIKRDHDRTPRSPAVKSVLAGQRWLDGRVQRMLCVNYSGALRQA